MYIMNTLYYNEYIDLTRREMKTRIFTSLHSVYIKKKIIMLLYKLSFARKKKYFILMKYEKNIYFISFLIEYSFFNFK